MKNYKFYIRSGLLPALLLLAWTVDGQSLVKASINGGAARVTTSTNTLVVSMPFYSTITGTSSAGSIQPGFLTGSCQKPPKPTITISGAFTESPVLTSSSATNNQWYLNGAPIAGATGQTHNVSAEGTYSVVVGISGCLSDFATDMPLITTGDLVSKNNLIVVHPNPIDDFIEVVGLTSNEPQATMIDMAGRSVVLFLKRSDEGFRASVSDLTSGIYLLRIIDEGNVFQVKVLKK